MVKSIRFPDELAAVIQAHADALERSYSWIVTRTMEEASRDWAEVVSAVRAGAAVRVDAGSVQAPVTGESKSSAVGRGLADVKAGRVTPGPLFKCPVARCEFRAKSPAAKCGMHGRTVVPG